MTIPLMSRVDEAAEKHAQSVSAGEACALDFIAGAQFLLTELSRAEEGHGPRGYVSLRKEDGGLTHIILWKEFADQPSIPYVSESLLLAARADHAVEVKSAVDIIFDQSKTIAEERETFLAEHDENVRLHTELTAERERTRKLREAMEYYANYMSGNRPTFTKEGMQRYPDHNIASEALGAGQGAI